MAYSPLGNWAKSGVDVLKDPTVLAVAAAHNVSAAQVALRWVVQQGVPAVTAATKLEYAEEDLKIFEFQLSAAEMEKLTAVKKGKGVGEGTGHQAPRSDSRSQ